MPIYEYHCDNCGADFEEWQKITEPAVGSCKVCGGEARRMISQSSFILKGSGWYVTDYARKGSSSASEAPKKSESSSDNSTSSGSSEKKTDAG